MKTIERRIIENLVAKFGEIHRQAIEEAVERGIQEGLDMIPTMFVRMDKEIEE